MGIQGITGVTQEQKVIDTDHQQEYSSDTVKSQEENSVLINEAKTPQSTNSLPEGFAIEKSEQNTDEKEQKLKELETLLEENKDWLKEYKISLKKYENEKPNMEYTKTKRCALIGGTVEFGCAAAIKLLCKFIFRSHSNVPVFKTALIGAIGVTIVGAIGDYIDYKNKCSINEFYINITENKIMKINNEIQDIEKQINELKKV